MISWKVFLLRGRLRYERGDEKWILNEYASSTAGRNLLGTMKDTRTFSEQTYADALASYNKTWDETYSLSVTAGGSFTKTSASSIELIGWGDKEFKVNNGVITRVLIIRTSSPRRTIIRCKPQRL